MDGPSIRSVRPMFRSVLKLAAIAVGISLAAGPATAQMHHGTTDEQYADCHLCAPRLAIEGAALFRAATSLPTATADQTTPLVRARLEVSSFIEHVGLFSQMEFAPADGPTPTLQFGLEISALRPNSNFNVTVGLGVADYRQGQGEQSPGAFVVRGWSQVGARYHTPLHEVTVYGQAGVPFSSAGRLLYQVGVSHPLAPYKLHLP